MPTRDAQAAAAGLFREARNGNGAVVIGVESAVWRSNCGLQSSSWNSISRADTSASAVPLWSSKQMFLSVRVLGLVAVAESCSASCKEHKDVR